MVLGSVAFPARISRLLLRALHSRWTLCFAAIACAAYFAHLSVRVIEVGTQWDFVTYYHAARAWNSGANPYEMDALSRAFGGTLELPYVYPPPTLWFFRAFTALDYPEAARLYLALKLLALGALLWLWLRVFVRDAPGRLLLLVLCIHAFRRPLRVDLVAGNISIFEQLLVWGGLACLLAGRRASFAVLIGVSACFKVVTLLLLPLVWVLRRTRDSLAYMALGVGLFAAVTVPSVLLQPHLVAGFRGNVAALDERGANNPASWAFIQDLGRAIHLPRAMEVAVFGAFVVSTVSLAFARARRLSPTLDAPRLVSLYLLTYGLILPRFKDYSYALLLVPATLVLMESFRTRPLLACGALALVVTARNDPYGSLAALGVLLVLACLPVRGDPVSAVALKQDGAA